MTRSEFEKRVEAARGTLMKRARARGYSMDDAEDLTQDAMLVVLGKVDWQEITNPNNYLLQVIDYLVVNARRKATATTGLDVEEILNRVAARNDVDDLVDRMAHDQEVKEQVDVICEAAEAAGLTRHEAYVFYARLRGKEYDEIAVILGLGRESCATYYSNALCKMRVQIKEHAY